MVTITTLDIVFIVAYFLLVILVAYFRTRKATPEEYLIAKRKLGIWQTIATINATKTGSILLIYTALLYLYGASAIWYFIGVAAGYLLFIPFAVRLHKRHGATHYTLADYFFHSYGKTAGMAASFLNILVMFAFLFINLIASSKVLQFFTGLSFVWSTIIVIGVVLIYLLMGGFKAVVTTDLLQYGAIVIILLLFAVFLLGGTSIPTSEFNIAGAGLVNILGFFILGILFPFADPALWQRVYAVKDIKTLKKGIFWSVVVSLVVAVFLTVIGLAVKTQFPGLDPDIALIEGFARLLPTGLIGLALVVFFAAFMSTVDTMAYTAASSFVQDFFKKLSKKQTVTAIKWAISVFVVLGALVAILLQDLVLGAFIFVSYLVILAVPTLLTWIKPKVKPTTLSTGIIFGIIALTILTIYQAITTVITPLIVLEAIGISIVGLIIGAIVSKFKN